MEAQLPQFDSSILLNLTKTIEGNLKKPVGKPPKPSKPPRAKQEKRPVSTDQQPKKVPSAAVKLPLSSAKQDAEKKRKPDGGKRKGSLFMKSSVNTIELGSRSENRLRVSKSRLEEEVLALGGEKGDLDLIADVGSESEMEEPAASASKRLQHGLEKDLRRLVMDLGISDLEKRELSSSSDAEEPEQVIEQKSATIETQATLSKKGAAEKPPRDSIAKRSSKLVITLRNHIHKFQLADRIFAAIGTASSMAFDYPTYCSVSGAGGCNSPSAICRRHSSACKVTPRE